jgi:hypothetical protein
MNMYALQLDYLRTCLCLLMLGYGSYRDLKTREIHDLLWVVFAGLGLIMDGYDIYIGSLSIQQLLIAVGFMGFMGVVLGYFKLFGEADLLAFVALVVIQPRSPFFLTINWGWHPLFYPLTIVTNTAIAGVAAPLMIFIMNVGTVLSGVSIFQGRKMSVFKKLGFVFTGLNTSIDKVRGPPFQYPLEDPDDGKLSLRPNIWDDEDAEVVFRKFRDKGVKRVWVSWTLPYIVVMLIGYMLTVVFGDLLLWVLILLR